MRTPALSMFATSALAVLLAACGGSDSGGSDGAAGDGGNDAGTGSETGSDGAGGDKASGDATGEGGADTGGSDAGGGGDAGKSGFACPGDKSADPPYPIFFQFEGQALKKAMVNDAAKNETNAITKDATIPPYLAKDAMRKERIDALVGYVKEQFAQFNLEIVTKRPASGIYDMIVFGGDKMALGLGAGLTSTQIDCPDGDHVGDVGVIFDPPAEAFDPAMANLTLNTIGQFAGLSISSDKDDCMCAIGCNFTSVCGMGSAAPVITMDPPYRCPTAKGTQDEPAQLAKIYGCRLAPTRRRWCA